MMLSLAISTLGLQPGRLPLTRTVPLARMVSPQLCSLSACVMSLPDLTENAVVLCGCVSSTLEN